MQEGRFGARWGSDGKGLFNGKNESKGKEKNRVSIT
jgi:hypothetical protein